MYPLTNQTLKEWVMFTIRLHCAIVEQKVQIGTFHDAVYSNSRITVMWGNVSHHYIVDQSHPYVLVSFDPSLISNKAFNAYDIRIKINDIDITESLSTLEQIIIYLQKIDVKSSAAAQKDWKNMI